MRKSLKNIKTIIFDFDGVLTDNKVFINQDGKEFVRCNRSDGLAIEVLKKNNFNVLILSSEKNNVVLERGKKLKVKTYNNCKDKLAFLLKLNTKKIISLDSVLYVGNDINDYKAMQQCKISACPNDAADEIKKISNIVLKVDGGEGIVKDLIVNYFKIDVLNHI